MEIGNEISQKIRAVIKTKLRELGSYVDDELPDYIMVMLANKRSKEQMTEDLVLFLGNNTNLFTDWLVSIIQKLQEVTSLQLEENPEKSSIFLNEPFQTTSTESVKLNEPRQEKEDVPSKSSFKEKRRSPYRTDATEEQRNRATEEQRNRATEEQRNRAMEEQRNRATEEQRNRATEEQRNRAMEEQRNRATEEHRNRATEEHRNRALKSSGHKKTDRQKLSSNVVKTVGLSSRSSVRKRKHSSSDEEESRASQLHSIVKVQERKPTLPPSKQAPSSLLKRAVAEAHLSVNKPILSSSLKYDPMSPHSPPIRTHSYEEKQQQKELLLQQHRELQRQLLQMEQAREGADEKVEEESDGGDGEKREKQDEKKDDKKNEGKQPEETRQEASGTQEPEEPVIELQISEAEALEYSAEPVEGDTRIVAFADSQAGGEDSDEDRRRRRKKRRAVKSKKDRPSSPKFIVTLDGVDSDMEDKYDVQVKQQKKKKSKQDETVDDFEDIETSDVKTDNKPGLEIMAGEKPVIEPITFNMDIAEDDEEEEEEGSPEKNKLAEKCKFWPECKNGDDCPFYHPTFTCRSFPSCRFGDSCRFIHPACKFDGRCTNSSCPYTHKLKNKPQNSPVVAPVSGFKFPFPSVAPPPVPSAQPVPCKFFPACTKTDCPFYHPQPKPCRFGVNCTRPNCVFSHPAKPSSLKWVSPSLHISERRFAVSEQKTTSLPVL